MGATISTRLIIGPALDEAAYHHDKLNWIEEEEGQERDEEPRLKLKLNQEQEDIQKWHLDYIQLMEHIKNPKYISHCADAEAQRIF